MIKELWGIIVGIIQFMLCCTILLFIALLLLFLVQGVFFGMYR